MKSWKAIALIVPAGMMIGMAAGTASRPVMVHHANAFPSSPAREARLEIEPYRPLYEGGPENPAPAGYSYRPDLDYSSYAWPDQSDPAPVRLEADYSPEPDQAAQVEVHRGSAGAELAGERAATAAADALAAAQDAAGTLPPVPPPVGQGAVAETESSTF